MPILIEESDARAHVNPDAAPAAAARKTERLLIRIILSSFPAFVGWYYHRWYPQTSPKTQNRSQATSRRETFGHERQTIVGIGNGRRVLIPGK
jgi:hypothetical protein